MPSFDFAALLTPFKNHLATTLVRPYFLCIQRGKCTYRRKTVSEHAWPMQLNVLGKGNFMVGNLRMHGGLLIRAAAMVEPVWSVEIKAHDLKTLNLEAGALRSSGDDSEKMDDRERLRRLKISKANKGKVPWNKGRKHSEETRQRIQERTKLAMQDPKVKMKLVKLGHAQSAETRVKIGQGVRMGWNRRRKWILLQETCCLAWQNAVADASRKGLAGEHELQWDSYDVLKKQLKVEWLESIEQRKLMPRSRGGKRAPKSPEQRRKISEAISAKWADPGYRDRVCSALAKYHGIPLGEERRPRRRPLGESQGITRELAVKKTGVKIDREAHLVNCPANTVSLKKACRPSFKDPLMSSKLEMIKNIRQERATTEIKKREAVHRAKLLIAEAEKAARVLETAAVTNPLVRASLSQTRKLIAKAAQSIQGIEGGGFTATVSLDSRSVLVDLDQGSLAGNFGDNSNFFDQNSNKKAINGKHCPSLVAGTHEEFDFTKFALHNLLNSKAPVDKVYYSQGNVEIMVDGLTQQLSISLSSPDGLDGYGTYDKIKLEDGIKAKRCVPLEELIKTSHPNTSAKKQWICGKLVEVEST